MFWDVFPRNKSQPAGVTLSVGIVDSSVPSRFLGESFPLKIRASKRECPLLFMATLRLLYQVLIVTLVAWVCFVGNAKTKTSVRLNGFRAALFLAWRVWGVNNFERWFFTPHGCVQAFWLYFGPQMITELMFDNIFETFVLLTKRMAEQI